MKGAEGVLVAGLVSSSDADGRRVYSESGKRALVERALAPGVSVSRLALDHGVNSNLLRKWIRRYQGVSIRPARQAGSPRLLPVVTVEPEAVPSPIAQVTPPPSLPSIEITMAGVTVHVRGAVDAQSLGTVLDCLLARR
ncbi:hypothetical protein C3942_11155 [Solimonas fluminis]|uniref:Transposase n=1 Tax=Solimonas fluminis TaxID=2086571 RepID=A0A2S5TG23_9GAMM|nr:transposase [Solimonas fluminis]PPE73943.1 hypothetical protein C3942_11155 [Solimonas fluminis]